VQLVHSTPRSADTATIRTSERRVEELENLATPQSRELESQFERIAQLQADCDILRIRVISPEQARTPTACHALHPASTDTRLRAAAVSFGTPRRVASRDAGSALLESIRMTYRIQRSTVARGVTFFLSGEMDSSHVAELEALMAAELNRLVYLDLADVTLVNREAITFLAGAEAAGAVLVNYPEYVRSWIDAEQGGA
jgi:ABC-type transporter Mla MlaB component